MSETKAERIHRQTYAAREDALLPQANSLTARSRAYDAAYRDACQAVYDAGYTQALRDVVALFTENTFLDEDSIHLVVEIEEFAAARGISLEDES